MSVFQKGKNGKWYYRFQLNGKEFYKACKGATNAKEAKQYEAIVKAELMKGNLGIIGTKRKTILKEGIELYLDYSRTNKKSTDNDNAYTEAFYKYFKSSAILEDITPAVIEEFKNWLLKKNLSKSTVNRYLQALSKMFNVCIDNELLLINPMKKVKLLKPDNHTIRFLDRAEEKTFNKFLPKFYFADFQNKTGSLLKLIVKFALRTGARKEEILSLKWSNIDFKNNLINIKRTSLYSKDRGIYQDTPKTEQSKRSISVPAKVMELLRVYKKEYNTKRLALGTAWTDTGFILVQENGKPMHPDTLTDYCSSFRTKYNNIIEKENKDRPKTNKLPLLPHINPHAFRHSQASMLILSGLDCATVSKRLGHANISTTTNIYTHILHEADKKASDKLENILLNQNKQKQVILN